jgi:hypothetical protein
MLWHANLNPVNAKTKFELNVAQPEIASFDSGAGRRPTHVGKSLTANPSIERTSTGLARRSSQVHVPLRRAKPVAAAHVKR